MFASTADGRRRFERDEPVGGSSRSWWASRIEAPSVTVRRAAPR